MKIQRYHLPLFLFSLLLYSCKTAKIDAPKESYQSIKYVVPVSTLNVPIELDVKLVKKLLNDNFTGLLYEDNDLEDDNLMLKAWKIKDFDIHCDTGDAFTYSVPLKLWIKTGWKISQFGIDLSDYRELEAQIVLNFRTKFTINKNWEIISNTNIESYQWLSKPIVKLGTFNVPITSIANALINSNKDVLNKKIDLAVKENVNVREFIQYLWEWVQEPIQISEEYKTWLSINPVEIYSTPIRCENGDAMMDVGLKTSVETFVGRKPITKINETLPFYTSVAATNQNFQINMLSEIDYKTVDSIAKLTLVGQTFTQDKYKVTVLDLNFYGQADRLVVSVKLSGSFNGNVFFKAVPYYDKESKSIKLQDFDFDFKTKNVLLSSFKWLYKDSFKRMIASKMVFPMSTYLDEIKTNVQPSLSNIDIYKNISAKCNLNEIDIIDLFLSEEGFKILVSINGGLRISIH